MSNGKISNKKSVISPFMSVLKFDLILFMSLSHRLSKLVSYIALFVFSVILCDLSFGSVLLAGVYGTVFFTITCYVLCWFVFYYSLTELRFLLFRYSDVQMTTRSMIYTAYVVLALNALFVIVPLSFLW